MANNSTDLGPVDLSSDVTPVVENLVANSSTNLDLVDLSSDVPSVEASSGKGQY